MKTATRIGSLALATAAVTALFAGPASAATAHPSTSAAARALTHGADHALFVQTDDVTGNHVAAYAQAADGTLTLSHTYATGGVGGVLPTSVIDHTASQGAVTYDRENRLLYVVNAGSNSVSVFDVDGDRLHLTQVVGSGGTFPVSIAVRNGVAYVVNAQNGGSIQGYLVIGRHLVPIGAWHRALGLDPTLTKFTQTPGQVAFSPDGRHLLVTTKANTNSIDVFRLNGIGGVVGPVVHNVRAGAVPFALDFAPDGTVLAVDAGTAAVTSLALHSDGTLAVLSSVPTGQKGTCWVIRDGKFLFTTNPGGPSVSTLALNANAAPTVLSATPTDAGTVDPAISHDGRFLYVETGANGIVDEFRVGQDGSLTPIGAVTVADAAGAEGLATD
jgi:6-phosphogluconolactonase (cycloisomerase 2 family)